MNDKNKHSFCPWKWQEVVFNPHQNYRYACCNSTEVTHNDDLQALNKQRQNLIDGIRDPSCEYCWKVEDQGLMSLRHRMLNEWNGTLDPVRVEINLGNICDIQCTYCSPKFSSKWNTDIKKKGEYQILFDKGALKELSGQLYNKDVLVDFLKDHQPSKTLSISGGEPLINPITLDIINEITVNDIEIEIPTNLIFTKHETVQQIIDINADRNTLIIRPSIDGLGETAEFLRKGFDHNLFTKNLDWLLKEDVTIEFLTLVTPLAIWDFLRLQDFIHLLYDIHGERIKWAFEYCVHPLTHTFDILTEENKVAALEIINTAKSKAKMKDELAFLETIEGALLHSKYNYLLHQDSKNFFEQFAKRHNTIIPNELTFLFKIS